MSKVILYTPSIATSNVGDRIIYQYCSSAIRKMFSSDALIELPTQIPASNKILNRFKDVDKRFICGSNLLQSNMFFALSRCGIATHAIRQWDISLSTARKYAPAILLGCGWQNYSENINLYTKALWRKILSKDYIHSVRDNYTLEKLKSIGIDNVINTGCPTTWALTPEFCKSIPTGKAPNAIVTITDYRQDIRSDEKMLCTVIENYDKVWLWLQGVEDRKYFEQFSNGIKDKVILVAPQLESYNEILLNNDVDYIGTRLHGGIHALNNKKRTIIIGVDNRAIEMQKDINLQVVDRETIEDLAVKINSAYETKINIPQKQIDSFLDQF